MATERMASPSTESDGEAVAVAAVLRMERSAEVTAVTGASPVAAEAGEGEPAKFAEVTAETVVVECCW